MKGSNIMKKTAALLLCFTMILVAFAGCKNSDYTSASDFEYHNDGDYVVIDKFTGSEKDVSIPEKIKGKPVIAINSEAFKGSSIESVTIPDSVEILLYSVFAECDQLKSVTFGSSVTYIGTEAFFDCDSLEKLELPKNLSVIGARAVSQCRSLKGLTIPGTLKTMNEIPFSHNESLTVVNIKDGLKVIEAQAFLNCPALESVTFPASVDTIYDGAFEGCTSLKDVYFCGDAPKHLESSAFGYDSKDKVTMHYNVGTSGTDSSSDSPAAPNTFDSAERINPAVHFAYVVNKDNTVMIIDYYSSDDTVIIPEKIEGLPVTKISFSTGWFNNDIKTITIPSSVEALTSSLGHGKKFNALQSVTFKGNAPKDPGLYPFGEPKDNNITIYYNSGTSGWDDTVLKNYYTVKAK